MKSFNSNSNFPEFPRDEVRAAISKGIQQAETQGYLREAPAQTKRKRKRKPLLYLASAAAAFGLLIGSAYVSPTLASTLSKLPIVGSVFNDSGLLGLEQASEQGLTSTIGKTSTINGISITVNEVLYDETNITIGFTIKSEKELSREYFGAGMDLKINGEFPEASSGTYGERILSQSVRTGISTFNVTKDMPDSFEMGLSLEGKEGEKWEFSIPIKKIIDIVQVPVNHQQLAGGIQLDVSTVSLSPSGVGLSFEATEKGQINESSPASFIEFRITDEHGREITSHSGGLTGKFHNGVRVYTGKKTFDPISDNVKELTITPYLALPTGGSSVEINENGIETEIEFNGTSLKEVEFEPFTVELPLQPNQ